MKRVILFLATNLAVMLVLSVVLNLLGVNRFLAAEGLNIPMLVVFSAVVGFVGSFFSLLISKPMAKWSTGAQVIENPQTADEQWLVATVRRFAPGGRGQAGREGGGRQVRRLRGRHPLLMRGIAPSWQS